MPTRPPRTARAPPIARRPAGRASSSASRRTSSSRRSRCGASSPREGEPFVEGEWVHQRNHALRLAQSESSLAERPLARHSPRAGQPATAAPRAATTRGSDRRGLPQALSARASCMAYSS
eukprot:2152877-Prymnesium_polylepis.1